jgi:hypothetical protein
MKAASLLGVLVVAKLMVLAGSSSELHWSIGTPLALFWQDAALVLAFALLERIPRARFLIGALYWCVALYVALNVPVIRMFSSPLTWPMLRATRGTLADSIGHHLDLVNLLSVGLVVVTAAIAPRALQRLTIKPGPGFYVGLSAVCLLGWWSGADVAGLQRNCVAAVIVSGRDQVKPVAHAEDWRKTSSHSALASWQNSARGRNVVLILLESTGARHLKFYGADQDSTPHLTQMAQAGIVFDQAYAAYPESIKGLFSILSSRYPAIETSSEDYRHIGKPALGHVLQAAGYRTALFHSGRFMYLGMDDVIEDRGYELLCDAGDIGGQRESSFGVEEPATVKRMLEWLEKLPTNQPFFLTYLPTAGHHPYLAPSPGPFSEETDARRYLNALYYGDQAVGQLIEGLKRLGRYQDTLFVFCGDHGEAFGEHAGNFGHTLYIYEENVRVPLVVFAPGLTTTQHRVPHLTSVIDIAPTILDLVELEIPRTYQGVSLLRAEPGTALFYTDYSLRLVGLREERWKFIYEFESDRCSLFNLQDDPREAINLSSLFPERTHSYKTRTQAWIATQKEAVLRRPSALAKR